MKFLMFLYVLASVRGRPQSVDFRKLSSTHHFSPFVGDFEIVLLPTKDHPNYQFTAFGKDIALQLKPNTKLTSPHFTTILKSHGLEGEVLQGRTNCHFLHRDSQITAAVSFCEGLPMSGLVFLQELTLEIAPLKTQMNDLFEALEDRIPHIVKRASPFLYNWTDEIRLPEIEALLESETTSVRETRETGPPVLETALFFDEAGYKLFAPYFSNDLNQLRDMLLAYVNGVQALYHHPSAGIQIDITLTRIEIFKTQPADLPTHGGERSQLLDSFCNYNAKHNPAGDNDPNHWDIGLYVSGLDFYAMENGRQSGVTMGLATVGGVCQERYACVIAEFGTTNVFGKPYPSAGFTSVYILAHEIGHNLGMHHDSYSNTCPKDGFIMSPSRGTNGETLWSTCSADILKKLGSWAKCLYDKPDKVPKDSDHSKFSDNPGEMWGAKKQCEVLLRDVDAELLSPDKLQDICQNLQCRTPHRAGFYFAGPALEGTSCGEKQWCQGGQCVVKNKKKPDKEVKGGWSEWKSGECKSGCLSKSKGSQSRRRICNNPVPVNTDKGCEGPSFEALLCKDEKICKKNKRKTAGQYATKKCEEFSKLIPGLDPKSSGLQAPHEEERPWMGCAIFCRRKDNGSYYTPRLDLNDLADPYFPDGTLCHNDGKNNYYCLGHNCLHEDVPLPQNARPQDKPLSDLILKYFSLDKDGNPLLKTLSPGAKSMPPEEDWSSKDYLDLPPK